MTRLIKKWKELSAPVKSAIAFTFSSLIIRGIAFITTPIFTRLMDQNQYGILSTYNSWNTILEVFSLLGLTSAGVYNTGLNDYRDNRDKFISTILILCNTSTIIVFAIICIAKSFLGQDFILPMNMLVLMFVQFLFQPTQIFWITREKYEFRYKLATIVSVASTLISQIIAVIFVYLGDESAAADNKVLGNTIGVLLFCIPIYIRLLYKGKTLIDGRMWKQILVFALPLIPHYLAQHVMAGADRIMIADYYSNSGAAIYSVISAISLIATVVWSAINASLVPITFESLNGRNFVKIKQTTFYLILAYGLMCFLVTLIAPEVLYLLAPEDYAEGIYAAPPITTVAFLNAYYNLYATIEFYHKKSKNIAVATIISCILNIILNRILIPSMGYVGAAYTTLISNIVLVVLHYCFYRRCQPEKVYDDKKLLIVSVVMIALCELCSLLYINNYIRYGFAIAVFFVAVIKRKRIKEILMSVKKQN